jgi:hypothetical protein
VLSGSPPVGAGAADTHIEPRSRAAAVLRIERIGTSFAPILMDSARAPEFPRRNYGQLEASRGAQAEGEAGRSIPDEPRPSEPSLPPASGATR